MSDGMTEELICVLSDDEVAARAQLLARGITDLRKVQLEKTLANAGFKSRLDGLESRVEDLAHQVATRSEKRDVEVEVRKDDLRYVVEKIRLDTGEVIFNRPMTTDEVKDANQQKLPGIGRRRRGTSTPEN